MPRRIILVPLLAVLGLCCVAAGQDPTPASKEPQLVYRIISVPEWVFTTADTSSKSGFRKPKQGVLPIPGTEVGNEEEQYDVAEFLKPYEFPFPAGSLAIYIAEYNMLVLRNTASNLDKISHILPDKNSEINDSSVTIEISAYECTPGPTKHLLPWERLTFSDLQNLPRGSVKLIDRTSLVANIMSETVASHVTNPGLANENAGVDASQNHGGDFTFQRGEDGAEIEAQDFNFLYLRYLLRTKLEGGGKEITKVNLTTTCELWKDYPAVINVAPVEDQPGKYIVVVAQEDMAGLSQWKLPPPKPAPQPVAAAKQHEPPANHSIQAGMALAIFKVPPGFLQTSGPVGPALLAPGQAAPPPMPPGAPLKKMEALDYLKRAGVAFPPGSAAVYDEKTSNIIAINTPQNMDLVDMIVSSGLRNGGDMLVSVELSAYEFEFPPDMIIHNVEKFSYSDLEELPGNLVKALGCISLVTESNYRAVAMKTTGAIATDEPQSKTLEEIWKFQPGQTGIKLEAQPEIDSQPVFNVPGGSIQLNIECTWRTPGKKEGEPEELKISSDSHVPGGEPTIVRLEPDKDREGKYIAIVACAKRVNFGGWDWGSK